MITQCIPILTLLVATKFHASSTPVLQDIQGGYICPPPMLSVRENTPRGIGLITKFLQEYLSTITNYISKVIQLKSKLFEIPTVRPYNFYSFIYLY